MRTYAMVAVSVCVICTGLLLQAPACRITIVPLTAAELRASRGGCYYDEIMTACEDNNLDPNRFKTACTDVICVLDNGQYRCAEYAGAPFLVKTDWVDQYSRDCAFGATTGYISCLTNEEFFCHVAALCNGNCSAPDAQGIRRCSQGGGTISMEAADWKYPGGAGCSSGG
jgi:hypothetical protein